MPLPKPSKTVSRRIKKPKPLLFPAPQPAQLNPCEPPSKRLRERRVRVICTDPDATDSSSDEEGEQAPFNPKHTHKRLVREICLLAAPPISYDSQQEEASMRTVFPSSHCCASKQREGFNVARKIVGLQHLYERAEEEPSAGSSAVDNFNACPGAEDFAQFLAEFLGVQEDGSIPAWDEELDLLDDDIFDSALNLEVDFESIAWINSVQTMV